MFSTCSNNMYDIHVNISDSGSESEYTEMEEIEEEEPELDPEPKQQEVLRKKIKKQRTTSAAKSPQSSVSGTRRKSKYWSHFHCTTTLHN